MAYDRTDPRRDRWREEDRGFFEKAGDEIASWFGDDEAERRRREDERMQRDHGWNRDWDRNRDFDRDNGRYAIGGWGERSSSRDYDRYGRNRDHDRGGWGDERHSYRPTGWSSSDRDHGVRTTMGGSRDSMGSPSPTYGYSGGYGSGSDRGYRSYGSSDYGVRDRSRDYDRSESPWGRDDYRTTSFAGQSRDSDRHYQAWRQRQLNQLDRDYDLYCRERQNRFENDFGSWRNERMTKRRHLDNIREHMDVVGSDGETVGKVDKVRGDRIILTRSDSDDNRHHAFDCSLIDTVEGEQVRLQVPAEEAKSRFKDDDRAMFGREEQEDTSLERSFSGTYTS